MKCWILASLLSAAMLTACSSSDNSKNATGSGGAIQGRAPVLEVPDARHPAARRIWCSRLAIEFSSILIATR